MDGYTLITGASGFIGNALAQQLASERKVVCLSRKKPQGDLVFVRGEFHSFEDLRQLDGFAIERVVHLAAATGGSTEEDALNTNVVGSRRLLRYALDRGCRKFVMASSIAAVGCLDANFVPLAVPIPDDHPCLATDAYGLSKALMEEITRYFHRVVPDSDFINLRLSVVDDPAASPPLYSVDNVPHAPFVQLAHADRDYVVRLIKVAVDAPLQPGVRVFNLAGPRCNTRDAVAAVLRASLGRRGDHLDLSWYDRPGHEHDPVYAIDNLRTALGLSAE